MASCLLLKTSVEEPNKLTWLPRRLALSLLEHIKTTTPTRFSSPLEPALVQKSFLLCRHYTHLAKNHGSYRAPRNARRMTEETCFCATVKHTLVTDSSGGGRITPEIKLITDLRQQQLVYCKVKIQMICRNLIASSMWKQPYRSV